MTAIHALELLAVWFVGSAIGGCAMAAFIKAGNGCDAVDQAKARLKEANASRNTQRINRAGKALNAARTAQLIDERSQGLWR